MGVSGGTETDGLLYGGETTVATLAIPDGRIVATSHRLLILTPEGDGPNMRTVDRPNVAGFSRRTNGRQFLRPTAYAFGGGLTAILLGSTLSLDGLSESVPTDGPAAGLLGPIGTLLDLVGLLDELLVAVGAIGVLIGSVIATVWLLVRESVIVVRVAGDDSIRVTAGSLDGRRVKRFASEAGFGFEE